VTGNNPPFVEVIPAEALASRARELGTQLTEEYRNREPVFVGVLQGSLPFLSDLVRQVKVSLDVDFLALSRFGEGGKVRIAMDTEISLEGRDVVVVEDIVDTGLTLSYLRRLLETRDVASLATVTLLDKAPRRIVDVPLEYRGFEVGDLSVAVQDQDPQSEERGDERASRSPWTNESELGGAIDPANVAAPAAWRTHYGLIDYIA